MRPQRQELFVFLHCVPCTWYNAWGGLTQIFTERREEDREVGDALGPPSLCGWKGSARGQDSWCHPWNNWLQSPSSERHCTEPLGMHTPCPSLPDPCTSGCQKGWLREVPLGAPCIVPLLVGERGEQSRGAAVEGGNWILECCETEPPVNFV